MTSDYPPSPSQSIALDDAPVQFHSLESAKVNGQWWVKCQTCGWQSLPFPTIQAAQSCECPIESAQLDSRRNRYLLHRELAKG